MTETKIKVAIIGAGMAGLTCACSLAVQGYAPVIFDKGRGPGGRMAARRAEVNGEVVSFDHGAQYFTAENADFAAQISQWESEGVAAPWPQAGEGAFVGVPGMNGPIRAMADGLDVRWGVRIETLDRIAGKDRWGWTLTTLEGESQTFGHVICAVPSEQAAVLLAPVAPEFAAKAEAVTSTPCWAAMAVFEEALDAPECVRGQGEDPIAWAARNASKPERGVHETWVIHGSSEFSRSILEHSKEGAADALLDAFAAQAGLSLPKTAHLVAHRWLYAFPQPEQAETYLWDGDMRLGVCGDWLIAPRVEDAFVSGRSLAQRITQA